MLYAAITVELSLGVIKTYLGEFEDYKSEKEIIVEASDENSTTKFIAIHKPASIVRTQQGMMVGAEPVDPVWVEAKTIKTVGKMTADLAREYKIAVNPMPVSAETGQKQEIVQ